MKAVKKNLFTSYAVAHAKGRSHVKKRPYLLPIAGLIAGGLIVTGVLFSQKDSPSLRPSESLVVYLHDKGQSQTLSTKAATVEELVSKLNLNLTEEDVIEPTLDTPIVEDNFRINIYRARPVTVVDGNTKTVILTAQKSPRMVATQAGVKINPDDIASFEQGNLGENIIGEKVVIARATPVLLNLYGVQLSTHTLAKTVGGMLQEKGIKLGEGENVSPNPETPISPNLQVFVLHKGAHIEVVEEAIPIPVQTVSDPTLSLGTTVVRQTGSPGKKAVTYITTTKDSKTVRQRIGEVIVQNAVPQIVAHGTTIDVPSDKEAVMAAAGIAPGDYGYVNYIISRESGWCPTKWQGQSGSCPAYHGVPASGGYGLGQATPGSKMASAGADWATNSVTQLKWCNGYTLDRYGSWAGAYNFWLSHHYW